MPSDPWTRHFLEAHVGNGRVPLGDLVGHFIEKAAFTLGGFGKAFYRDFGVGDVYEPSNVIF